ncbi:MAG: radical SAM protein [Myxococcota bacterium]|jgi:hypothetical protein|nr:radical SAM protein [Myxococcota bacterium]
MSQPSLDLPTRPTKRDALEPLLRLEGPVESIEFNFTNRCNLRCVYCPQGSHEDGFHAETADWQLDEILGYIDRNGVKHASIGYYGETTMVAGWEDVCERLMDRGVALTIVSNFSRVLSEREFDVLSRFEEIQVSIDSVDQATLRRVRKSVDVRTIVYDCQRIQAAALVAGRPVPRMIWTGVLTREVVFGLREFVAMAASCSIKQVNFNSVGYFDGANGESLHVCDLAEADFLKAAEEIERALALAKSLGVALKIQDHGRIMRRVVDITGRTRVLDNGHYLASIDDLSSEDRIYVYGSGEPGRYIAQQIQPRDGLDFAAFLDSSRGGEVDGAQVIAFEDYMRERGTRSTSKRDVILVCSSAYDEIEKGLVAAGVERYLDARELYLHTRGRSGGSEGARVKRQGIQGSFAMADQAGDTLAEGLTRLCDSPWTQTYTDPKGEVYSCCQRGEVMGQLSAKTGLARVLNQKSYRDLRKKLLTGRNLPAECAQCLIRPPTTPADLQRHVRAKLSKLGSIER